ncbi:hypothetical protein QE435_004989 [Rhizobium sp. SORGH_AS 787]|nr:hypothetical protein [Rhizobium sp. SORGH_AS_0787]
MISASVTSRREASHLLDTVEEPFHEIALTIGPAGAAECLLSIGLCRDSRPAFALLGEVSNCVGVICLVGEDRRARPQIAQQLFSHRCVGGLASGELQANRSAICIDKGVDLGCQATA